jgi:predicted enzyme related to lactoylglutathione lyase
MFSITCVKYMLMVEDMKRALTFYRDGLGLAVKFESDHWSELDSNGAVVALHSGGSGQMTETGLSFEVDDIEAAVAAVTAAGATLSEGPSAQEGEGVILADLFDPEGNGFMLSQAATDA